MENLFDSTVYESKTEFIMTEEKKTALENEALEKTLHSLREDYANLYRMQENFKTFVAATICDYEQFDIVERQELIDLLGLENYVPTQDVKITIEVEVSKLIDDLDFTYDLERDLESVVEDIDGIISVSAVDVTFQ